MRDTSDCALLVVSCDSYNDLWRPFFTLLQRHWPDCPFEVFLGAGELNCNEKWVTTLHSSGGRDWSRCMHDYLTQISCRYVIVMLDDFFIRRPVDTQQIFRCLDFAATNSAISVRLMPRPGPTDRIVTEDLIGACALDSPYRLSMQAAVWDRTTFASLLRPGESIWQFEHAGNERSTLYKTGFFCVSRAVLPYTGLFAHHVVEKGKWLPHEKWIFSRQQIGCDFTKRATLSIWATTVGQLAQILDKVLSALPWRTKARIKRTLKKLLQPILRSQFARMRGA